MDDFRQVELFEGKNLSDLFQEIYLNSTSKKEQIKNLIADLSPLISNLGDATLLVPLIKDYLDISVKNDEQLIKLAQIVQRIDNGKKASTGMDFFGDLESLLETDKSLDSEVKTTEQEVKDTVRYN